MTVQDIAVPHYWALIDVLPVAVLYKEQAKKAVFANQAALQLLALPATQAILSLSDLQQLPLYCPSSGQPFSLLDNPLLLALSGSELQQPLALAGATFMLQSKVVSLAFSLHSSVVISLCQANLALADPQRAQSLPDSHIAELKEALAFDKLISLISTELINVRDSKLDQHIEDALAAVGEFCHADRSYIFRFNHDGTEMSNTHEWVRDGIRPHKEDLQQIPDTALPYFNRIIKAELVFAVDQVASLPPAASAEKQEFDAEDIQSVLCCAMQADDKLLGFVGCDMVSRQRNWTANDLRRMKLVGDMLANALQNVSYRQSLQHISKQLQQANAQLQQQANQDGLTGIANRRHFDQHLAQELQRAKRHQHHIALLMLDIDFFKAYNDNYGHQAGDRALQRVAQLLQQQCRRQGELAARYGGEEFALILPGSSANDCQQVAKQVQQTLATLAIPHQHSANGGILSVSIGYCAPIADKQLSANDIIAAADKALFQAKAAGRNHIIASVVL